MSIQPSSPAPASPEPGASAPEPEPAKKKRLWEIAFTSTPVLLTVIATLLASRSSGELTQGQYARTVAGQNQAKAGDQWAFFQAKRVRGTVKEAEARRGAFQPAETLAVAKWLPKALDRTGPEAEAVLKSVDAAQKATDDAAAEKADLDAVKPAVEKYQKALKKAAEDLKKTQKALAAAFAPKGEVDPEFVTFKLPAPKTEPEESSEGKQLRPRDFVDMAIDRDVLEVLVLTRAIEAAKAARDEDPKEGETKEEEQKRKAEKLKRDVAALEKSWKAAYLYPRPSDKPDQKLNADNLHVNIPSSPDLGQVVTEMEAELTKKVKVLDEQKVHHSIEAAEAKADKFDKSAGGATGSIRKVADLLQDQAALFRSVQGAAKEVQLAALELNSAEAKVNDVRKAADTLQASADRLANESNNALKSFREAQADYEARRYDREAAFNRQVAVLYELQVSKASLTSDIHRERSYMFFYAMLAAQAGVTIATFSLAVRQKSVLWALATAAGATAISIGIVAFVSI